MQKSGILRQKKKSYCPKAGAVKAFKVLSIKTAEVCLGKNRFDCRQLEVKRVDLGVSGSVKGEKGYNRLLLNYKSDFGKFIQKLFHVLPA